MKRSALRPAIVLSLHLAAACAIAVTAGAQSVADAHRTPASITGTWDVVSLRVDRRDQPAWFYRPDDPQWVGREVRLTPAALVVNRDGARCREPRWTRQRTTWSALLRAQMPRSPTADRPVGPHPRDFGLTSRGSQVISVFRVQCAPADSSPDEQWQRTWLVPLGQDRLLLSERDLALLELRRRPPAVVPAPSFRCDTAHGDVLRTVCGDVGLAAWDRSVAIARTEALRARSSAGERAEVDSVAAFWYAERGRCGGSGECLRRTMQGAVDALWQLAR